MDSYDDPFLLEIEKSLAEISDVSAPGAYLVDAIPSLVKYVPEWFPAASFKRIARETRERSYALEDKLYQAARRQLDRGSATPSFVANLLKHNYDPTQDDHTLYAEVAVMFYGAGADTTVSSILSFFLIMATHPDIQRKAQAEVDSVTSGRLPICSDREDMPYLGAVLKEVHRCNPVLPLALPHYVREEDVYAGYRVPAGSTILPNTWYVIILYVQDANEVIPERYYDSSNGDLNPDPQDFAFGYGRRVCPGRTLAEDTLFIVAASVLASFNITSVVPLKGETIEYRGGAISHPDDFACGILPRRST
ncbi:hypothetical protein EVJ58_g1238 [Rhodofomes roseus]|uniref:Cytochrome P450 n=1 Tax=Rhodofomes roseus TaxID=34475 RepID=A0A4Y9Z262_9APHY|nr:hypothetical protein EVJ58_g1238 [Rhodofomes roseus]